MTWIPNVKGAPIDLVEPCPSQVDFEAEAHALANLNRYNGHGSMQVSVARHKLIGLDLCPRELRPHWLCHDIHETRLGEITRPTVQALTEIGRTLYVPKGGDAGDLLLLIVGAFKSRHDAAIHTAAGLPLPSSAQRSQIEAIDHRCLATEHRDFHQASARKWHHEIVGILPAKHRAKWAKPDKTAEELLAAFRQYLPAFAGAGARDLLGA